jgi:23S rRNA (cytidine1920-2'-O)/16S rRNA (cytidine1409-2'-O)-methyltransferase
MAPDRRKRLDQALVDRGLAPTRSRAQALVLAGRVFSGECRLDKAGQKVDDGTPLEITPGPRYVGRGAHKLEGAVTEFGLDVEGRDTMDVGASTGGFTQVLLEAGARRVIALDVGRGLLDWTLRNDRRVHVLEGINARYLEPSQLPFPPEVATIDVSFISLERVLPPVVAALSGEARVVALVKPQFEVGRGKVGKGGIVRDPALHREVLRKTAAFARLQGWGILGVTRSSIRGAEGNAEFFVLLAPEHEGLDPDVVSERIEAAVAGVGNECGDRDDG